jgi:DNA repair protein RadC
LTYAAQRGNEAEPGLLRKALRRNTEVFIGENMKQQQIQTTSDSAAMFRAALPKEQKEERVFVLPLDGNGRVLAKPILVSVGHEDGTALIDAGAIFREALKAGAEEIIVAHNHPSGDPTPSKADCDTTVRLNDGADLVGLELIDHIIIGSPDSANGQGFVSIAELMT